MPRTTEAAVAEAGAPRTTEARVVEACVSVAKLVAYEMEIGAGQASMLPPDLRPATAAGERSGSGDPFGLL